MRNQIKTLNSQKPVITTIIIIAFSICIYSFIVHRQFYNDDAYISLRYAYNLIHGNGFVWNIGQPVEGYTNFLFIILASFLGKMGVNLVWASRLINLIGFILMNIIILYFFHNRMKSEGSAAGWIRVLLPITLILNISPLISWIYGGLEAPLYTMLVTSGVLFFSSILSGNINKSYLVYSSLFFSLATMTRPDGLIFAGVTFIFLVFYLKKHQLSLVKMTLIYITPFLLLYLPYFIWRYSYYGDLLPLTFYVKSAGFSGLKVMTGLKYIFSYMGAPPFALAAMLIVFVIAAFKRHITRQHLYIFSSIFIYMIYLISIGGDYMYSFRLILPLVPSSIILLYLLVESLIRKLSLKSILLSYFIVFCLIILQYFWHGTNIRYMTSEDRVATEVGKYISQNWAKGSVIALNTAGATPYYANDFTFIDMLGLNDAHIAKRKIEKMRIRWQKVPGHYKGDGAYVLSRKPDYIIVGPARGTIIERPWFLSDFEMMEDPSFKKLYQPKRVRLENCIFTYYERINKQQ